MTGGNILPNRRRLDSEAILSTVAAATARAKSAGSLSSQAVAEIYGKEDRKSAVAYLAGETDPGIVGLVKAASDERFGAAYLNDVLGPLLGLNVCPANSAVGSDLSGLPVGLSELLTVFLRSYADMHLDHREILALAGLLRPLMPHFQTIIAEADRVRG